MARDLKTGIAAAAEDRRGLRGPVLVAGSNATVQSAPARRDEPTTQSVEGQSRDFAIQMADMAAEGPKKEGFDFMTMVAITSK